MSAEPQQPQSSPDARGRSLPERRHDDVGVEADQLREVMARSIDGVVVLTAAPTESERAADPTALPHAMTATSFASIAVEPPLVMICVNRAGKFHRGATGSGGFAVSLLAADQEGLARHFADSTRDRPRQFDRVAHRIGHRTGAPLVDGAMAWLECVTEQVVTAGDHDIFIGRVLTAEVGRDTAPLMYFQRSYWTGPDGRNAGR